MADTKLAGKKVLMVIPHTQFRDEEFFEPKAILEDSGATVQVASSSARTLVSSIDSMRALVWALLVRMGTCQPA